MTLALIILSILCGLTIIISALVVACLTMFSAPDRQNGVEQHDESHTAKSS